MVRTLSSELHKKAAEELNEDSNRIRQDLSQIRDWLEKQKHLHVRNDDQWLLAFLRGSKFSLQRTKEKIDYYYTLKTVLPEFFSNRGPCLQEVQEILKANVFVPLPKTADPAGPRIIVFQWKASIPEKMPFSDLVKAYLMIVDILMNEDDNCVVAGLTVIVDYKEFPMKYLQQVRLTQLKQCMMCFQSAHPIRLKRIHLLNVHPAVEFFVNTLKMFLNEKMRKRLSIHTDSNLNELYKDVPQSILPKEYGGNESSINELGVFWYRKVNDYKGWFLEDEKYHSDETLRVGEPRTSANMFGVEGSFRKLTVE